MIELQLWCAKFGEHVGDTLVTPFSRGEFTYATNGKIMVRVPRREDVADGGPANVETVISDGVERLERAEWLPMEALLTGKEHVYGGEPCGQCKGSGLIKKCKDCDGAGWSTCSECDGEKDCKTCKATGVLAADLADELPDPCDDCGGDGLESERTVSKQLDWQWIDQRYLEKMLTLPGLMIAKPPAPDAAEDDRYGPKFLFKFDEGIGVCMPMIVRKEQEEAQPEQVSA